MAGAVEPLVVFLSVCSVYPYNRIIVVATDSATILKRVIDPERRSMSPELAQFVLDLDFPPADHARFEELSAKAQERELAAPEAEELDGYLHIDNLLAMLRLKAEKSLAGDRGSPDR